MKTIEVNFKFELDIHSKYLCFLCSNCGSNQLASYEESLAEPHVELVGQGECYVCDHDKFLLMTSRPIRFAKGAPAKYSKKMKLLHAPFHVLGEDGAVHSVAVDTFAQEAWLRVVKQSHKNTPMFSTDQAIDALDGIPSESELNRLVHFYPQYTKLHRAKLLKGMISQTDHALMIDSHTFLKHGQMLGNGLKGGYAKAVSAKIRRTVLRLLYLRLRLDKTPSATKNGANGELLAQFGDDDFGPGSISDATKSDVVNAEVDSV